MTKRNIIVIGLAVVVSSTTMCRAESVCVSVGKAAEMIMTYRQQSGKSMSALMESIKGDDANSRAARYLILEAYTKHSRYNTKVFQQRTISDFRNKMEARCYSEEVTRK